VGFAPGGHLKDLTESIARHLLFLCEGKAGLNQGKRLKEKKGERKLRV
jgi:hypothetical protein